MSKEKSMADKQDGKRREWARALGLACVGVAFLASIFIHDGNKQLFFFGLCLVVGSLCWLMTSRESRR